MIKKNILKKMLIAIALLMLPYNAYADAASFIKNIDKILTISSDFEQTNEIKGFGKEKYKGKVNIITKDKAIWDYSEPAGSWYLFKRNSFEYYDPISNEMSVYKDFSIEDNLLLSLLMDLSLVTTSFKSSLIDNTLTLTPMKEIGVKYIEITIENDFIKRIKNIDYDDNTVVIDFTNMKFNLKIDNKLFKKTLPDNATINEYTK